MLSVSPSELSLPVGRAASGSHNSSSSGRVHFSRCVPWCACIHNLNRRRGHLTLHSDGFRGLSHSSGLSFIKFEVGGRGHREFAPLGRLSF